MKEDWSDPAKVINDICNGKGDRYDLSQLGGETEDSRERGDSATSSGGRGIPNSHNCPGMVDFTPFAQMDDLQVSAKVKGVTQGSTLGGAIAGAIAGKWFGGGGAALGSLGGAVAGFFSGGVAAIYTEYYEGRSPFSIAPGASGDQPRVVVKGPSGREQEIHIGGGLVSDSASNTTHLCYLDQLAPGHGIFFKNSPMVLHYKTFAGSYVQQQKHPVKYFKRFKDGLFLAYREESEGTRLAPSGWSIETRDDVKSVGGSEMFERYQGFQVEARLEFFKAELPGRHVIAASCCVLIAVFDTDVINRPVPGKSPDTGLRDLFIHSDRIIECGFVYKTSAGYVHYTSDCGNPRTCWKPFKLTHCVVETPILSIEYRDGVSGTMIADKAYNEANGLTDYSNPRTTPVEVKPFPYCLGTAYGEALANAHGDSSKPQASVVFLGEAINRPLPFQVTVKSSNGKYAAFAFEENPVLGGSVFVDAENHCFGSAPDGICTAGDHLGTFECDIIA